MTLYMAVAVSGCMPLNPSIEGLPCGANGECARGFQCDASANRCLKEGACTPDGAEVCDNRDNDCDGLIDEELDGDAITTTCRAQHGDGHVAVWSCVAGCHAQVCQAGFSDLDQAGGCEYACVVQNGGRERCDGVDDDCNGVVDDGESAQGCTKYYRDEDGDGFGVDDSQCLCAPGPLYRATLAGDCNDLPLECGADCFPGNTAEDICDLADQDCDSTLDEQPDIAWYHDADSDGFTSLTDIQLRCTDPDGDAAAWLNPATAADCDDAPNGCGANCFPANPVVDDCDGNDQDCNGLVDDALAVLWYHDSDGDSFTNNTDTRLSCTDPDGAMSEWVGVSTVLDCNDQDAYSHPTAAEICDGNDNDCNGVVPAGEQDGDGDHRVSCSGWQDPQGDNAGILSGSDCDDNASWRHPGHSEVCDNRDNDCDTASDEGLGSACACTAGARKPLEICGDGIDNDCNTSVDETSCVAAWWACGYGYRRPLSIKTEASGLFARYAVKVVLDHAALVAAGKSLPSGEDVRVVFHDGAVRTELTRALDPESQWNSSTTAIWFALEAAIPANTTNRSYAIYYGNAASTNAPAMESNVFDFADYFERGNAPNTQLDNDWMVLEDAGTNIHLKDGAMHFTAIGDGAQHTPSAAHAFGPFTSKVSFRFGYDWRRGNDTDYRIYMQVGSGLGSPAADDAIDSAGVAVNLLSGSASLWQIDEDPNNALANEGFGYFAGGLTRQLDVVSGVASIEAIIDPATDTYSLRITRNGFTRVYVGLAFANSLASINTVRFMAHRVGNWSDDRDFEWVIIRRYIEDDATVTVDVEQPNLC